MVKIGKCVIIRHFSHAQSISHTNFAESRIPKLRNSANKQLLTPNAASFFTTTQFTLLLNLLLRNMVKMGLVSLNVVFLTCLCCFAKAELDGCACIPGYYLICHGNLTVNTIESHECMGARVLYVYRNSHQFSIPQRFGAVVIWESSGLCEHNHMDVRTQENIHVCWRGVTHPNAEADTSTNARELVAWILLLCLLALICLGMCFWMGMRCSSKFHAWAEMKWPGLATWTPLRFNGHAQEYICNESPVLLKDNRKSLHGQHEESPLAELHISQVETLTFQRTSSQNRGQKSAVVKGKPTRHQRLQSARDASAKAMTDGVAIAGKGPGNRVASQEQGKQMKPEIESKNKEIREKSRRTSLSAESVSSVTDDKNLIYREMDKEYERIVKNDLSSRR